MFVSAEIKALGFGVLAALLVMGGTYLMALAIQKANPVNASPTTQEKPIALTQQELADKGRRFYGLSCAHCHGDNASGDEGPDLRRLKISDAHIALVVRAGIKGEMPSFEKKYSSEQIGALIAYLRTLK